MLGRHWAPVWQGLDRLGSSRTVVVTSRDPVSPRAGLDVQTVGFRMSLLPPHIRGSRRSEAATRFVADRVRARARPHCNPAFQALAHAFASTHAQEVLTLVDVGAHLGDCCLWAAARFGQRRVKCIAFERDPDAAAALRQSVMLASLEGTVEVHARGVGPRATNCSEARVAASLDCILGGFGRVDIVKIHVGYGAELLILTGLLDSLRLGKVALCLVRTTVVPIAHVEAFLQRHRLPYLVQPGREGKDVALHLDPGWATS